QSVNEALLEGGRLRVRPVLMTALTTILALIPMSVGLTDGAIIAAELAVVVIGGLLTSTFLTLLVVPVVYNLVNRGGRLPRDG
ncbi:MAG TPA: efflux RND transporter permease subunit, partial [Chloroflexota bacterium]|nr:efflux RND transporter permease subunit [Chloroflexota bacterium]HJN38974.1 efflux RND transporter permease subunit [Chloroflexota bacterium]